MLMLKSQWLRNSNECDVEYTTPLEKCKDDYYQLKLDSIWTQTPETKPVVVPVNYEVYDGAYIACIDSNELVDTKLISQYCRNITSLLNAQGRFAAGRNQRESIKFHNILQSNHHTLPEALYNNDASDVTDTRFFQLKLPANTYIFANNIYPLYALHILLDPPLVE